MEIKTGVSLQGLSLAMRPVLIAAENIWKKHGIKNGVTVTCGTDGTHSAGSLHYYGYAIDLRTRYFDDKTIERVLTDLTNALSHEYDVVLEQTHIHVEYDPFKDI